MWIQWCDGCSAARAMCVLRELCVVGPKARRYEDACAPRIGAGPVMAAGARRLEVDLVAEEPLAHLPVSFVVEPTEQLHSQGLHHACARCSPRTGGGTRQWCRRG